MQEPQSLEMRKPEIPRLNGKAWQIKGRACMTMPERPAQFPTWQAGLLQWDVSEFYYFRCRFPVGFQERRKLFRGVLDRLDSQRSKKPLYKFWIGQQLADFRVKPLHACLWRSRRRKYAIPAGEIQ